MVREPERLLQDVVLGGCQALTHGMTLVQLMIWGCPPGQGTTRSPKPGSTTRAAVSPIPMPISCVSCFNSYQTLLLIAPVMCLWLVSTHTLTISVSRNSPVIWSLAFLPSLSLSAMTAFKLVWTLLPPTLHFLGRRRAGPAGRAGATAEPAASTSRTNKWHRWVGRIKC